MLIYAQRHSYQVITLMEKLQAKEEDEAPEPEEQGVALREGAFAPLQQDQLCIQTATGGAAPAVGYCYTGADSDSPESYYLAGARSPPSSSEDDCGGGDGDACPFFVPDPKEDGVQLNNWAWLWNEQQY
jgi:homeobox-leucine zipper protein